MDEIQLKMNWPFQNINRDIFEYVKSLIDCNVFEEIYLNFLPVGHTHCDQDQMFSRLSVHLNRTNFVENPPPLVFSLIVAFGIVKFKHTRALTLRSWGHASCKPSNFAR